MSKFVDEIIKDLKDNPKDYKVNNRSGIEKREVEINSCGNIRAMSLIHILINDKEMITTYIDRWKLEVAISEWYRTIDLKTLINQK